MPGWDRTTAGSGEKGTLTRAPAGLRGMVRPGRVKVPGGEGEGRGGRASSGSAMGLRAGGALSRAGAGRGAPEGPGPSGGAQGGSIHSGCIAAVHNVPLSVLIRPLPSVLDPAKVQSLVDTIQVRPRGRPSEGGCRRRQVERNARGGWFPALPEHYICCVTLSKWLSLSGPLLPHLSKQGIEGIVKIRVANIKIALAVAQRQF